MTDETNYNNIGLFGYIILFVIIVWVFGGAFGGYGGFGRGGFGNGLGFGLGLDAAGLGTSNFGFQDYKAICDSEKADITRTATTQYLIEQQSAQTRELVNSQSNAIATKIDFYQYQNLRDAVSERDRKIAQLQNEIFVKDQLAPVNAQLANIQCNMLTKPIVTGVGVCTPNAGILNGLGLTNGINALNNQNCYYNYGNIV